ncbi:Bifunctional hemolysin/adenylate cyclase precursor [Falsiruegeria litorea R37]|uniref:Bifunctional hemolysin/adenylate cyclase n=1 Tax=Falsiruegeria litorea R37 TaxID=1200284 RepID=A0A1Y5SBT9_9RHOB|nr:calcium-binding protein [Falsiruegeria litorea]SLN34384.1 Bifunctional hemolysin/adenylate cyclase precursor [Falsiruegeria litorea R37]
MANIISVDNRVSVLKDAWFNGFFEAGEHYNSFSGVNEFFLDNFANTVHLNSRPQVWENGEWMSKGHLYNVLSDPSYGADNMSASVDAGVIESISFTVKKDDFTASLDETEDKDRSEIASHRYVEAGRKYAYSFDVEVDFPAGESSDAGWLNIVQLKQQDTADAIPLRVAVYADGGGNYVRVMVDDQPKGAVFRLTEGASYNVSFVIEQHPTDATKSTFYFKMVNKNKHTDFVTYKTDASDSSSFGQYANGEAIPAYLRLGVYRDGVGVDQEVTATYSNIEVLAEAESATVANRVDGTSGNDVLSTRIGFREDDLILAQDGHDLVKAGHGDDSVRGGNGNDTLYGDQGNDTLYGEAGNDVLDGATGDDHMLAHAGNDTVYGRDGNDTVDVGSGNDKVWSGSGDDYLIGGSGNDSLTGDAGTDTLSGGVGQDTLRGGTGDDRILGGEDGDFIFGGDGNDLLHGQAGNDTLRGEGGDDTIEGNAGDDLMIGGAGADTFVFRVYSGHDTISGFDGDDQILLYADPGQVTYSTSGTRTIITVDDGSTLTINNSDPHFDAIDDITFM